MFIKNGSYKKHTHIISYVPPTIITQPLSATKNVGDNNIFFVSAKGSKPLNYQWYKNTSSLTGLTSNELNLTNLQLSDDAEYYCEVSNNGYSILSDSVKLTIIDSLSFVTQPSSVQVNPNSNIFFSVSVITSSPVTYKWYKNSVIYPGTSNTIYINFVKENQEGSYFCVVSNLLTSITSNSATLKLNDPIIIKTQPSNVTSDVGDNITLSLSCVGTFPISAQWRKNNTNYGSLSVTNDGDVKLEISNVQYSDEGNYDCILSNIVGSVTSNKSIFYINKPPTFNINPSNGIGYIGRSFTLNSNATGTNPISYQWIKENAGIINGATLKNYTLDNLNFSNSGRYACVASNLCGSVTSTFASLSVQQLILYKNNLGAGRFHSLFLGTDGTVSACGINSAGQLGDGTRVDRRIPVKINLPPVSMIAGGNNHSLFLGTDGTLSACGYNSDGQLGDGTTISRLTSIKINLPPVSMIAAGGDHSLFLGTDGTVSACGYNNAGQLGDGTRVDRRIPVKINLPPVSMIAGGSNHSLFLGTDGTLSACGYNSDGQLGDGTKIDRLNPIKINLPPVSMIAAGGNHSLFLGTDGTVSACGINGFGQLGDGTKVARQNPIKINLPPVSMIAAAARNSLFLGTDGTVSACGDNSEGQLGDGTTISSLTSIKINLPPVSMIAAGYMYYSLFLGTDGTVSACGDNSEGQLGDGTKIDRLTPVKINLPLIF